MRSLTATENELMSSPSWSCCGSFAAWAAELLYSSVSFAVPRKRQLFFCWRRNLLPAAEFK